LRDFSLKRPKSAILLTQKQLKTIRLFQPIKKTAMAGIGLIQRNGG